MKLLKNLLILALVGAILILTGSIFADKNKGLSLMSGRDSSTTPTLSSPLKAKNVNGPTGYEISNDYMDNVKKDLENLLAQIKGAGEVRAEISFDGGYQYNYATNKTQEETVTQEKDTSGGSRIVTTKRGTEQIVTLRGSNSEEPLVLEVREPTIKGVLVVAEGAADSRVKERIAEAVRIFLNLPAYKVIVVEGKFN